MPRRCRVCDDSRLEEINKALLTEAYRQVARRFDLSPSTLYRHRENHLAEALAQARERATAVAQETAQAEAEHGADLGAEIEQLKSEARTIGEQARSKGDLRTALDAIGRLTKLVELAAKRAGEVGAQREGVVYVDARQWTLVKHVVEQHPEVRRQLSEVLEGREAPEGAAE